MPLNMSSWAFTFDPAGAVGTVTFSATVAVNFGTSFIAHACMTDSDGPSGESSTEHAGHIMRRRTALQAVSCPSYL